MRSNLIFPELRAWFSLAVNLDNLCLRSHESAVPPTSSNAIIFYKQKSLCCCCSVKSCPTCDLMDCSPPGSSVHGISQARILEWVAISYSRGSSQCRDRICVFCIGRWIFFFFFLPLSLQGRPAEPLPSCKGPDPLFNSNVATAEKSQHIIGPLTTEISLNVILYLRGKIRCFWI